MTNRNIQVGIFGGGISGITCALLLQSRGYKTRIYSRHNPASKTIHSDFISGYPSASIIPHSVFHPDISDIFRLSQNSFETLSGSGFPGVIRHEHYELYSKDIEPPWYVSMMPETEMLDPSAPGIEMPLSLSVEKAWKFRCFFADWNIYFDQLIQRYQAAGGSIEIRTLSDSDISRLDEDLIVNCSELGSNQIFPDTFGEMRGLAGHLLYIKGAPKIRNSRGEYISYNYTPRDDIYGIPKLSGQDVYMYSREDGWILGGSRIPVHFDNNGSVKTDSGHIIKAEAYPHAIQDLNFEIVREAFGINTDSLGASHPRMSYRLTHPVIDGLYLDSEMIEDKLIIHNVGHGGAGVTVSWGCAYKVYEILCKALGGEAQSAEDFTAELPGFLER